MLRTREAEQALRHFREWWANNFDDFAPEINMQLLYLDNEAAYALGDEQ